MYCLWQVRVKVSKKKENSYKHFGVGGSVDEGSHFRLKSNCRWRGDPIFNNNPQVIDATAFLI